MWTERPVVRAPQAEREMVQVDAGRAYEVGRLVRAGQRIMQRKVEQVGPSQFRVLGNDEPEYFVDPSADIPCYCKDSLYHGRGCLHELAARMVAGDVPLLIAWGTLLARREAFAQENGQT